ncbi:hypothetical protein C8Q75DRAFT_738046 [Abortiporus biennis]|nr:hypothetical protein C8Q75DRAFT_738046 [Abortiporus biennis]
MHFQRLNSHFFAFITIFLASCPFVFNAVAVPILPSHGDGIHVLVKREPVISWDLEMENTINKELPQLNDILGILQVSGLPELSKKAFLYSHFNKAMTRGGSKAISLFNFTPSQTGAGKSIHVSITYPRLCRMVKLSQQHPASSQAEMILILKRGFIALDGPNTMLPWIVEAKGQHGTWMDGFRSFFGKRVSWSIRYFEKLDVIGYVPTSANAQAGPSRSHQHGRLPSSSSQAQVSNSRTHADTMQGGSHASSYNPSVGYPAQEIAGTNHRHPHQQFGGVQSHEYQYPQPYGAQGHSQNTPPPVQYSQASSSHHHSIPSHASSSMNPQDYHRAIEAGRNPKSSSLSGWNGQHVVPQPPTIPPPMNPQDAYQRAVERGRNPKSSSLSDWSG